MIFKTNTFRGTSIIVLGLFLVLSIGALKLINSQTFQKLDVLEQKPAPRPPQSDLKLKGSIPYWDQEKAFASFKNNVNHFDYVSTFWYFLDSDGSIQKYKYANEDPKIISFAHNNDVKIFTTITNLPDPGDWDSERVENVIENQSTRQKHIEDIKQNINNLNFDGVIIDYEMVNERARDNFSDFIDELSDKLHKENKVVAVALHPKSGENKKGEDNGSKSQDWQKLAKSADQLYIMGYGEHWDTSASGPIASAPWIKRILDYATILKIDRQKLYLGIPLYGYSWKQESNQKAKDLKYSDVQKILADQDMEPQWDETAKSPHFQYDSGGESYKVWFENAQSVKDKVDLAKKYGLGGVNFWRLGDEDPTIWESLE